MKNFELDLYVVQNSEGQFFRAKGFGGSSKSWVDEINKAKIYPKISQARSRVSFFANNYPTYGIPKIIKLKVVASEIIDEKERVIKNKEAKERREEKYKAECKKQEIERLEKEMQAAQQKLYRLRKV